jgi:hypothetical protein
MTNLPTTPAVPRRAVDWLQVIHVQPYRAQLPPGS